MGQEEGSAGAETVTLADLENLRRRHAELEVLYQTVRDLSSTLAVHEVIERLLDRILRHLDAEIGSVLLLHEGCLRIVHSRGLPEKVVADTEISRSEGISGHVLDSGRSLLVADVEADDVAWLALTTSDGTGLRVVSLDARAHVELPRTIVALI